MFLTSTRIWIPDLFLLGFQFPPKQTDISHSFRVGLSEQQPKFFSFAALLLMAVSVSTSTIPSLNLGCSNRLAAPSSSSSSLQFPLRVPQIRIGTTGLRSPSRPRVIPLVRATKQTFSSFDDLLANTDKPVLVDFYATWCGPCQFMAPVLNEVSAQLKDTIQVVKIDTEKYPSIADKYRIEALPTFIIFKDGKPYDRFEGALTADQLIQQIENSLKVKK